MVRNPVLAVVERFAGRLRFPYLFALTAVLFVLDLLIPDLVPLADEIILGLATLVFAAWKERKQDAAPEPPGGSGGPSSGPVIDDTPKGGEAPSGDPR